MESIAVALAIMTGGFAAIGVGIATAKAAEAVSRQPEASGKIMQIALIGMATVSYTHLTLPTKRIV